MALRPLVAVLAAAPMLRAAVIMRREMVAELPASVYG
jgi:hypothetical protein